MHNGSIQTNHRLALIHHPKGRSGPHRHYFDFAARAVLGIDLGTSNSAVAITQDGDARIVSIGEDTTTPSWVAFTEVGCLYIVDPICCKCSLWKLDIAVAVAERRPHRKEGTAAGAAESLKHLFLGEAPDWEAVQRHTLRAAVCMLQLPPGQRWQC